MFRYLIAATSMLCFALNLRAETSYDSEIRPLVETYCLACHGGDEVCGEIDFTRFQNEQDLREGFEIWESVAELVRDGIMPPEDHRQPTESEKQRILDWYRREFIETVLAHPGTFHPRRLSAHEYRNTLHSVFGFSLDVAIGEAEQTVAEKSLVMKLLPTDPPGRSGFKNDTSGNPLTTVVWDQYAYLVDFAIEKLFSTNGRTSLDSLIGQKDARRPITKADAKTLLRSIARRAFRRDVDDEVIADSLDKIDDAPARLVERTLRHELKFLLMSPRFFYRGLMLDIPSDRVTDVDAFELAERISYFLWADMPDAPLMQSASSGRLLESEELDRQIDRMLASPKARSLADHLGVEWFALDEIDHVSDNPPVADALKSQPIDYLNYLFTQGRPILELIDSKTAFVNQHTASFYPGDRNQLPRYQKSQGIEVQRLPNHRIELAQATYRGGFLTIPGVLAMNRGPVLRGTWMLERILGDELPDPPANVGQVPKNQPGESLTFRERFEIHRSNTSCAVCHDKIDPLGFALEFFDDAGSHLVHEGQRSKKRADSVEFDVTSIDASGRLPSGEPFNDFEELKQILLTSQNEPVIRNVIERFLSYALCRKLEYYDQPTVEQIYANLSKSGATFHDLIHAVCSSTAMRQTFVRSE